MKPTASLSVENVTAGYNGTTVVRNVSFRAEPGQVLALLGANGAGKTTTLSVVAGALRLAAGVVRLGDLDISRSPQHRRAQLGIAYVLQGGRVFRDLTVEDNLALGALRHDVDRRERVDYVSELFPVLGERRAQVAGTLSGGEQQMLAIARALMSDPRAVLLDEPSWGLSPIAIARIAGAIAAIKRTGACVVLVEQNLGLAKQLGDHFVVLQHGEIADAGEMTTLDPESLVGAYLGRDRSVPTDR